MPQEPRPQIFWNVHPGLLHGEKQTLIDQWVRWKPKAVLVMNDPELAMFLQEIRPDAIVIYRHWPDNSIREMGTPQEYLQKMISLIPDPRIVLYAGNELLLTPDDARWIQNLILLADRVGRSLVVANIATGNPNPTVISQILIPILELMSKVNTTHYLGLHEYYDFHDPFKSGWNPLEGDNWLIGRFRTINDLCRQHGVQEPKIILTEHGADSVGNIYNGYHKGLSGERYGEHLILLDELVYRGTNVLAQLVFSYGNSGGWSMFDVSKDEGLFKMLDNEYSKVLPPLDLTEWDYLAELRLVLKASEGSYRVNLRGDASGSGEVVGLLAEGQRVYVKKSLNNGYYEVLVNRTLRGFAHKSVAAFEVIERLHEPEEPEAPPEPPVTKPSLEGLINVLQTYRELMRIIKEQAAHAEGFTSEFIEDLKIE